jgi:hypothetical protein
MHARTPLPQIGQWYLRLDKGESFLVTGYDDHARTIEIQSFDGDIDEIDMEAWAGLPVALSEPPENVTGPIDDVVLDDLGYSETAMKPSDWETPLQPLAATGEDWESTAEDGENSLQVQTTPNQDLVADSAVARDQVAMRTAADRKPA